MNLIISGILKKNSIISLPKTCSSCVVQNAVLCEQSKKCRQKNILKVPFVTRFCCMWIEYVCVALQKDRKKRIYRESERCYRAGVLIKHVMSSILSIVQSIFLWIYMCVYLKICDIFFSFSILYPVTMGNFTMKKLHLKLNLNRFVLSRFSRWAFPFYTIKTQRTRTHDREEKIGKKENMKEMNT